MLESSQLRTKYNTAMEEFSKEQVPEEQQNIRNVLLNEKVFNIFKERFMPKGFETGIQEMKRSFNYINKTLYEAFEKIAGKGSADSRSWKINLLGKMAALGKEIKIGHTPEMQAIFNTICIIEGKGAKTETQITSALECFYEALNKDSEVRRYADPSNPSNHEFPSFKAFCLKVLQHFIRDYVKETPAPGQTQPSSGLTAAMAMFEKAFANQK